MSAANRAAGAQGLALELAQAEAALDAAVARASALLGADSDAEALGGRRVFSDADADALRRLESRVEAVGRSVGAFAERLRLRAAERGRAP